MVFDAETQEKNLAFWRLVEKTDPKITKKVEYGKRKFTTIDANAQIKNFTRMFGMYGDGWGIENESFHMYDSRNLLLYQGTLWYIKDGEKKTISMASAIKVSHTTKQKETVVTTIDDECVKKVRTDALTKEMSRMGFNADIFMGRFDDNRYVAEMIKFFAEQPSEGSSGPANVVSIQPKIEQAETAKESSRATFADMVNAILPEIRETDLTHTLHVYSVRDINDVTAKHDQAAIYRTLLSYTKRLTKQAMLKTIDAELRPAIASEFFDELVKNVGIQSEGLVEAPVQTVALIYRSLLFQVNAITRSLQPKQRMSK